MISTEIKIKGWVVKQSRFLKQWRKRYCVLTQNNLITYKNENIERKYKLCTRF